jgi:hypothetical protein
MEPTVEQLTQAIAAEAANELTQAAKKITHCLDQLTDEQIWWRPLEEMNSIGNLVLHVCGNLRQWIVSGVGGAPDTRERPREFSERGPIAKAELIRRLSETVQAALAALAAVTPDEMLRPRKIQAFEVTALGAVFHSLPHFRGHAQEIIHQTRVQLGDVYQFAWTPAMPRQGPPP